jgi:hypothetical protein
MEVWKPIKGYEGLYEVSSLGNVKSLNKYHHRREQILKPKIDKYGYLCVKLSKNGKPKDYTVHRLVANTFIGESDLTVNHKDKNRQNNNIENLEYMSVKDNVRYSLAQKIKSINLTTGETKIYSSMKSVKEDGHIQANVWKCLKGIKKTHHNCKWRYVNAKEC